MKQIKIQSFILIKKGIAFLLLLSCLGLGPTKSETGMASYYSTAFHGKPTASGERFDMHALTAAHKTLPFQTIVRVTNLSNKKTVEVRINDRGPFAKGRIIDLSYEAAKRIDMIQAGVAKVKVEIIKGKSQPEPANPKPEAERATTLRDAPIPSWWKAGKTISIKKGVGLQAGSFTDDQNVLKRINELEKLGYPNGRIQKVKVKSKIFYRVFVEIYADNAKAKAAAAALKKKGIATTILKIQ
jgi:rare lipoprotein A